MFNASILEALGFRSGKNTNHSPALPSNRTLRKGRSVSLLVLISSIILAAASGVGAQSYSGQATTARLTVTAVGQPVTSTAVADTGDLPSTGGNVTLSSIGVNLAPVAVVGASTSSAQGSGSSSTSTASVNDLSVNVLGNTISTGVVSAATNAGCPSEVLSGNSVVTSLVINGSPVTVTGATNQTVTIFQGAVPVGTLVINEQVTTPRSITVNALHLTVTDPVSLAVTDLVVSSARSVINCGFSPVSNLYSGRGTGLNVRQADVLFGDVRTLAADTGPLPTSGGALSTTTAGVNILGGLVTSGTAASASSGGVAPSTAGSSNSSSSVQNLGINLLAGTVSINATVLSSNTQCTCSLAVPTCTGNSTVTGLAVTVGGLPVAVTVTGATNEVVNIPVLGLGSVTLTLNGRESGGAADITAYPLRVQTNLAGLVATDIVTASSHSDIVCALPHTAAPVSVRGRVLDQYGRGIPRVRVTVSDGDAVTRTAVTNSFGYYTLADIPAGNTYILTAQDKRYLFEPQALMLNEDLTGVDIYPVPPRPPAPKSANASITARKTSMWW